VLAPAVRPGQAAWLQALCGPEGELHLRWFTLSHGLAGSATISTPSWQGLLVGGGGGPMQLTAQVTWLPHARSGPEPVVMQPGEEDHATRWIELGIEKDGHRGTGWIAHDDAQPIHLAGVDGAAGDVLVRYRSATYSLKDHHGFSLELERFDEATDPGGAGAATFASHVHIRGLDQAGARELSARLRSDEQQARERLAADAVGRWLPPALLALMRPAPVLPPSVPETHALITMNEPLAVGGVTLYQSSFQPEMDADGQATGRQISVFTVAQDRGRLCKYLGSALLVGGILLMYFMRRRAH
jgi:hypothetical protein